MKYFVARSKRRITVFTQDAVSDNTGSDGRRRRFTWKLNTGFRFDGSVKKIAIESIKVRDMSILINTVNNNHDYNQQDTGSAGNARGTQRAIMTGNTDEKEMYSIRCPHINNVSYDTRPNQYQNAPLIYVGSLDFNNNDIYNSYCYECNDGFVNSDFTLYFDSNYKDLANNNETGIKANLHIAITFVIYDGDEVEYLTNAPLVDMNMDYAKRTSFIGNY